MNHKQRGATAIEFCLVLLLFFMFLLGILDFSRMLFTWNAANEATRAGARYAVVCATPTDESQVIVKMQALLPQITDINLDWEDEFGNINTCTAATCVGVTVTIVGMDYQWISPLPGMASKVIPMPTFSTFLTREVMRADPNSPAICV